MLKGGFNRWTHKKSFGPLKMAPPTGEGAHFSASFKVPRSAHAVNFVLSDEPEGEGTYDNRGGLDYHLPVEGSEVRSSWGLGDRVHDKSLSRALVRVKYVLASAWS